jgi:hypothetical protein
MKKILIAMLLALMLACSILPAMAEGEGPTDFFTWASLGTFAGAVAATVFIVQACKMPADKVFGHVPTRLIVYFIALALLLMAQGFLNGGLTFDTVCLAVVNAFLVALAAMQTYSLLIEQAEHKKLLAKAGEYVESIIKDTDQPSTPADTE